MEFLIYFLTLVFVQTKAGDDCFRIRKQIMIENEESSLGYIATMFKEIEMQKENAEIRNSTANLILESLSRMSHGWCKPELKEDEHRRQERSLALAIAALISLGTFILGPAISALLHELTENTKWRRVEKINGIKTIRWMEEVEKRLVASEKVEEILASIMLHESIMSDLLQHTDKRSLNRTWEKVFKVLIEIYTKNGFSKAAPEDIRLVDNDSLLPNEVYHYTVIAHTNDNCKYAKIKIKAVGIIPSLECFKPHEDNDFTSRKGFIKLKTDKENMCIFTGNSTVKLADNSTFSLSNSIVGPCQNTLLDFKTHKNTLLIHPIHDRAYMMIRCEGNKEVKNVIFKDELVVPPAGCITWVMENKRKKPELQKDFTGVHEDYISSEDGSKIEGNINVTKKSIIFLPFTELADLRSKTEEEYMSFFESFLSDAKEEQPEENNFNNFAIGMACTLALVAIYLMWHKIRKRRQLVAHSAEWHVQGNLQNEPKTLEVDLEEITELLKRIHSDSEEESGSHRSRSNDVCHKEERKHKAEERNKEQKEYRRRSSVQRLFGGHEPKEEDYNIEEELKDEETENNSETYYNVPRIFHEGNIYECIEYHDDMFFMEAETKKNDTSKTNTMRKRKMEDKGTEGDENKKSISNDASEKEGEQVKEEVQYEEMSVFKSTKDKDDATKTKENDNINKVPEMEGEQVKEEPHEKEMSKDKHTKERDNATKEKENDNINRKDKDSSKNLKAGDKKGYSEDLERNKIKEKKHNTGETYQGSLHEQMLKELHTRFLAMKHLHNF